MRRVAPALALAAVAAATVLSCSTPGPAGHQHASAPAVYYLALGDSLSQGIQPDASGASVRTRQGYPDQLYTVLRSRQPGLRLVKLGCPGETTVTMIHGGICSYAGGSQLAAADRFLRAHRGRVWLVTLDIGANDPNSCITQPSASKLTACASSSVPRAAGNLATILRQLRRAGPHTRIIAMNYYLPALAAWRNGVGGQLLARGSELVATGYNALLTRVYQTFGVRVADVSGAFDTSDFSPRVTVPGLGPLPRNVAAVCRWTWECAPSPRGPNEHPNQAGYQVIARAFLVAGAGQGARS